MPGPEAAIAALILAIAAIVQGFLGFGFGIVAMTFLTLSQDLVHAAGVVNVTGMLITGTVLWTLRHATLWRQVGRIVPGLLVGVFLGVYALARFDLSWMTRVLGATVVGISVWNLVAPRLHPQRSWLRDVGVGLVSGTLGGAFNTGGPPIVAHLYSLHEPPEAVKASVQALFLTISLTRLPLAASQGLMGPAVWSDAALAVPGVLVGLAVGIQLARRLGADEFRRAAWFGLGALGVVLLVS